MTDRELALWFREMDDMEARIRRYWQQTPVENLPERDASLVAVRHATALRKSLEQWITARACRAALTA